MSNFITIMAQNNKDIETINIKQFTQKVNDWRFKKKLHSNK